MTNKNAAEPASTTPSPEVLGGFTQREWVSLSAADDDQSPDVRPALREELRQIINAETLVILAGSGTSLGIYEKVAGGNRKRLAPSMTDLWESIEKLDSFKAVKPRLDQKILESKNLEHILSDAQARALVNETDTEIEAFVAEAEKEILDKCSFVDENTPLASHEIFLRKVSRRSTRLARTQLFTTNYDLAFETAAERTRFHVIDGFGFGGQSFDGGSFDIDYVKRRPNEKLALETNVFQLLKLHGSVNWHNSGTLTEKVMGRPSSPVLIYPSATKFQLSYQQPYLELMSRFQIALRQRDVGLIIVGFGFNDDHLNAPIEAAIRANVGLRAVVVAPGANDSGRNGVFSQIEDLIVRGDRRLTMLAGTFDDLVVQLPEASDHDEQQEHAARLSERPDKEL